MRHDLTQRPAATLLALTLALALVAAGCSDDDNGSTPKDAAAQKPDTGGGDGPTTDQGARSGRQHVRHGQGDQRLQRQRILQGHPRLLADQGQRPGG